MKTNYFPWRIDLDGFYSKKSSPERLEFLVNFAVLAPSSHNSQPWRFSIGENFIELAPDLSRALPVSDKNNRQLFVSLGCALENLLVAADYYGYESSVRYPDSGDASDLSVRIALERTRNGKGSADHPVFSVLKRRTNRGKYRERPPDEKLAEKIRNFADDDTRVDMIGASEKKNAIADAVLKALVAAMDDGGFRTELSKYLKSNVTKSPIGMPASGFGIPTLPSLFAPAVIRRVNVDKLNRKKNEELLKKFTPAFVVISTREDGEKDWVRAGRIYERMALESVKAGAATGVMAAAIQIGEFHKELQNILKTDFRPQVFFRLGYAENEPEPSPRLSAPAVIEKRR
jgi:nitroreductase